MAPKRRSIETRILAHLSRRPLRRGQLAQAILAYPVTRLDAALDPLIASGQVMAESRKPPRGPTATVYRLAGSTETR